MKKILSSVLLLAITATSVFGMYGNNSDWIDFLTHGNQMRAKVDQFGVTIGNGTLKGTFGFKGNNVIFNTEDGVHFNLNPVVSAGFGFTTDAFGIGLGYNYNSVPNGYNSKKLDVHTPVIVMNFLNNNIRIALPVQVAATDNLLNDKAIKVKYTGISLDPQFRYYTGMENFTEVRLIVKYGMNKTEMPGEPSNTKTIVEASTLGFDFRLYFAANYEDIALSPFIKVTYDTLLNAKGKVRYGDSAPISTSITAGDRAGLMKVENGQGYRHNPYDVFVMPALGMSAGTDIVSLYVEPSLGIGIHNGGMSTKNAVYMAWNAYGEVYITPIKNLEWYFEAEVGNGPSPDKYNGSSVAQVNFNTSTGITWYLPAFDGSGN